MTVRQRATGGRHAWILCWLVLAASGALAACETKPTVPLGTVGHVRGFSGAVAADEPTAVHVAREVLSAGGSAADAAVALDFTLAVTLPSRASLGGGGVCIVRDNPTQKTEVLDFTPRAGAAAGEGQVPIAVPGNARAMFALQSKYGHLLWEQLLAPAEKLARKGAPVSKALAQDLALAAAVLAKDAETMRVFGRDGGVRGEGDKLVQTDLGILIGRLRAVGPGDFYEGMLAPAVSRRFAEAAGGAFDTAALRDYQPEWREPIVVAFGEDELTFAPPPAAAGAVAAQMWLMAVSGDRYKTTPEADRAHLLAEAGMRAFAARAGWLSADDGGSVPASELASPAKADAMMASYDPGKHTAAKSLDPAPVALPENPAATSFVVVDREGSAVACSLTMNNLFGLGRMVRDTGIMAAAAPAKGGGVSALLPMLTIDKPTGDFVFGAAASGGQAAPSALVEVALGTLVAGRPLAQALAEKRIHHAGAPDVLVYEKGVPPETLDALARRGHKLHEIASLGLVAAVFCRGGLPEEPDSCAAAADPRGAGDAFVSKD